MSLLCVAGNRLTAKHGGKRCVAPLAWQLTSASSIAVVIRMCGWQFRAAVDQVFQRNG